MKNIPQLKRNSKKKRLKKTTENVAEKEETAKVEESGGSGQ